MEFSTALKAEENVGVKHFCPSCFMSLSGDTFPLLEGRELHNYPACLIRWAEMPIEERSRRTREVVSLESFDSWVSAPPAPGRYWMRIRDVGMLIPVTVLREGSACYVGVGGRTTLLSGCSAYEFFARS